MAFNGKRKAIFHWLKSKILIVIVLEEAHCLSVELLLGYFFCSHTKDENSAGVLHMFTFNRKHGDIFLLYTIQINNTQIC